MKTINLSVDEATWREARKLAAEHDTSVSAMVRNYLTALAKGTVSMVSPLVLDEDRKNREELIAALRKCNLILGYKPSREKTYER